MIIKSNTRIYCVLLSGLAMSPRLVRASNRGRAERHVARDIVAAHVATQDDIVEYLCDGIEIAGEETNDETKHYEEQS